MVKERFVETYSQGVTNVRKISNFNCRFVKHIGQ